MDHMETPLSTGSLAPTSPAVRKNGMIFAAVRQLRKATSSLISTEYGTPLDGVLNFDTRNPTADEMVLLQRLTLMMKLRGLLL